MPNDGKMGYAPVGIRIIYPEKRMSLLANYRKQLIVALDEGQQNLDVETCFWQFKITVARKRLLVVQIGCWLRYYLNDSLTVFRGMITKWAGCPNSKHTSVNSSVKRTN